MAAIALESHASTAAWWNYPAPSLTSPDGIIWTQRAVIAPALSTLALARLNLTRVRRALLPPWRDGTARYRPVPRACAAPRRVVVERGSVGWIRAGGRRPLRGLA